MKTQLLIYFLFLSIGLQVKTTMANPVNKTGKLASFSSITWNGSHDNNWNNSSNWSSTTVPQAGDDVVINTGASITIAGPAACSSITISGAGSISLTISGTLTISGFLTNSGTLTITNGIISLGVNGYLSNTTGGNFNLSGATINMGSSGYINNAGGATFTINGNSTLDFAANSATSAYVQNDGTFYAGTSNSSCTINLNYTNANINNAGTFYLGSSSSVNLTASGTKINNTGTFTLQSDINGSATIGAIASTSTGCTGIYNIERYLSANRGYRLLSSPVYAGNNSYSNVYSINYLQNSSWLTGTTGSTGGFDKGGNPTLYLFREDITTSNASFTTGNFRGINAINNTPAYNYTMDADGGPYNIPVGNGYLFYFRGNKSNTTLSAATTPGAVASSATLTASGTLNAGSITVNNWYTPSSPNLGNTNTSGSAVSGFNLVGNPYASSIDWDTYNTLSSSTGIYAPGIAPFLYVLMPNGNYNVYEANTGGVSVGNISNSNIIPSGQGFFVQATGSTPTLTFNESAKTAVQAVGPNLFMGTPPQAAISQYLHLMLKKDSVNAGGILINFNSNASEGYVKGEDAPYKPGYGSASLSSISADGIALSINKLALPKLKSKVIPLNVNASVSGVYQLNLTAIKSIPKLYDIWLMDAYNKDSLDIKHNPTYSFDINKNDTATYGSKRFTLVIRQNAALGVHLLDFTATKAPIGAQIVWKTENEENYTSFTVERSIDGGVTFDVLDGVASSSQGTYSFTDKAPSNTTNLYILKLVDLNGTVSYSKIVPVMYGNLSNTFAGNVNVYPNPSNGVINLAITGNSLAANLSTFQPSLAAAENTGAVTYGIKIIDVTGSVIKTATSTSANWQNDVSGLLPGTYIIQVMNNNDKSLVGKSTFIKM